MENQHVREISAYDLKLSSNRSIVAGVERELSGMTMRKRAVFHR